MERPYLFNAEYLEALGEPVEVPRLNWINNKILSLYNSVKSEFASGVSGYFEFAFQAHFGAVDELEAGYIQIALEKTHEIVKKYQEKQTAKAAYYQKLREKIGEQRNGISP